eukprot:4233228-Amphidinium_carterae.1
MLVGQCSKDWADSLGLCMVAQLMILGNGCAFMTHRPWVEREEEASLNIVLVANLLGSSPGPSPTRT